MLTRKQPTVSILIKALNEERHIAAAIESALAALGEVDGEVILADGGSSDRTVEIARRYPVTIVQLARAADRSCGSGAQLGFQYSSGRYLLLIDADMRVHDGFLPAALAVLEAHSTVGGVGGSVIECRIVNQEFEQRDKRLDPDRNAGPVTRLNGCGLYRRAAIESIGYLTDRNLHGAEELDLGARLHARGWTLIKIERPAVDHHGHAGSAYCLLLRRMTTRNSSATGELFRAAIGRSHFWFVARHDRGGLLCVLVAGWWSALLLTALLLHGWPAALTGGAILLLPIAAMSLRWRSVRLGMYSIAAWNVYALSFLPGFLRPRTEPASWIESTVLKEGAQPHGGARAANGSAQTRNASLHPESPGADALKSLSL